MQFTNSVKDQARPWFTDESQIPEKLKSIDEDIKPYVEQLIENGFAIIPESIPKSMCEDAIQAFRRLEEANRQEFRAFLDSDGHYPRMVNMHAAIPELFALFSRNPISYRVQEALFCARPALYTSLFYERGSAQTIHRDTPVFSTKPEHFYFGVWVALENTDPGNGALQVCRGGHKLPELDLKSIALQHYDSLDQIAPTAQKLWADYQDQVRFQCESVGIKPEPLYVKAGDTVIWHPQLPHGGGPIADFARTRFSLVMHTTPVGVPVYHQDKFFNPDAPAVMDAPWWYEEVQGHMRMITEDINFGHKQSFKISSLKPPLVALAAPPKPAGSGLLHRLLGG